MKSNLKSALGKSGKKKVNPVVMARAAIVLCSFIQENYPEEYEKYCSEVGEWAKQRNLKFG